MQPVGVCAPADIHLSSGWHPLAELPYRHRVPGCKSAPLAVFGALVGLGWEPAGRG